MAGLALTGCLLLLLAVPHPAIAQDSGTQAGKEQLAVLEFEVIGSGREQGAVLTNQLRAELLKTGRFTMVNRAQLDRILAELALQQQLCTRKECAVEVGKLLGVRHIVTGSVTKVTDTLWQVSASLTSVETGEIRRQEVINHAGDFASLFLSGMASVAARLGASDAEVAAGGARLAPESIAPAVHDVLRKVGAVRVAFAHDSSRLYFAARSRVHRWNIAERREVGAPIEADDRVTALAVSRTGERLAIGTKRGEVLLADADSGRIVHREDKHSGDVTTLAFSPADNFLASGGEDDAIHVYQARTGDHAFKLEGADDPIATLRFSGDGKSLVAASHDRNVRIYDVNVQREVRAFSESARKLLFAEISGDGALLGIAAKEVQIDLRRNRRLDTELIKIRDVKTGAELLSFEAHEKDITGVAFFPDTRYLASGGADGQVKVWDLRQSAMIASLPLKERVVAIGVSPNGRWLVAADEEGSVTIWAVTP